MELKLNISCTDCNYEEQCRKQTAVENEGGAHLLYRKCITLLSSHTFAYTHT